METFLTLRSETRDSSDKGEKLDFIKRTNFCISLAIKTVNVNYTGVNVYKVYTTRDRYVRHT